MRLPCYYNKATQISLLESLLPSFMRNTDVYITKALHYSSEIAHKDHVLFINYYLRKEQYNALIPLLKSLTNKEQILSFLLMIPEKRRYSLIQKDTALAALLAREYLKKNQYLLAQQFYSNIEALSPEAAFIIAIQKREYLGAYELFKRNKQHINFPQSECQSLARIFFELAEDEYGKGRHCRAQLLWNDAKTHYYTSLLQKKAANELNPTEEHLEEMYVHQRLYAQVLVDADLNLNSIECCDSPSLQKAITLLRECAPSTEHEKNCLKMVLANALMRQIDRLREDISLESPPSPLYLEAINIHKTKHQDVIKHLIKQLRELVTLLEGTQERELRLKLGKAYFLLADIHEYWSINDPDVNQNYENAMRTVPENPFYVLRVSELIDLGRDERIEIAVPGIKRLGYEVEDYLHWFDERWVKKANILFPIKDIHISPAQEEPSARSSWFGVRGMVG